MSPESEARRRHPLLVWAWSLLRLKFVGVAFGALFFCLSLTPSLVPREWLFQGLIGGVNAAFGYGLGVVLGKVVDRCLQLFGGYGYMDEYPISRIYRDARVMRIYAGTNEIMKMVIARSL